MVEISLLESDAQPSQTQLYAALGKLLEDAGSAMDRDQGIAKDFIARARSLLRSKVEPGSAGAESSRVFRGGLAPWQMRRVKAHIDANLTRTLLVSEVAQVAKLSTSHFCRAFKVSFAETPHAYINRRRIEHAQGMMRTTGEPLSQIALACGLCDQAHFSRVFRRVMGLPPNEWRRRWPRSSNNILAQRIESARLAAVGD
jgi:AraC family transcriptional regulator